MNLYELLLWLCFILCVCLILILAVAFLTLFERKVLAAIQRRRGPNKVGIFGLLQPLLDAFKLILKELSLPARVNINLFFVGPMIMLFLNLIAWAIIIPNYGWILVDLNLGMLYILGVMALNIYGFISSGWASNSKYSFLGAIRAAAQMLGYELMTTTILVMLGIWAGSFDLSVIISAQQPLWYVFSWPLFMLFYLGCLAETARVPFDLPEAESELVAGYNVEYASISFAFFFLAEYGNIILTSNLVVYFFWGGALNLITVGGAFGFFCFFVKLLIILYWFILIRATLPRFRFDQLMSLGWLCFLPIAMVTAMLSLSLILVNLNYLYGSVDYLVSVEMLKIK